LSGVTATVNVRAEVIVVVVFVVQRHLKQYVIGKNSGFFENPSYSSKNRATRQGGLLKTMKSGGNVNKSVLPEDSNSLFWPVFRKPLAEKSPYLPKYQIANTMLYLHVWLPFGN
jgi:hypothetical protein